MNKTLVFYDASFPYAGERPDDNVVANWKKDNLLVSADEIAERLPGADCFIHLHGPYFPKQAWRAILKHLRAGKGIVLAGGAPFKIPVVRGNNRWRREHEQTGYHQQLYIQEALAIDPAPIVSLVHHADIPLFKGRESLFAAAPTYGLVVQFARAIDRPGEIGSAGPMDAHIYPLLKGLDRDKREIAAPAVLIEHTRGQYAGGRWMLINQQLTDRFWAGDGADALMEWAGFCANGVTEMWLKTNYASYEPGERPVIALHLQNNLSRGEGAPCRWQFDLKISMNGQVIRTDRINATASRELTISRIALPFSIEPGFYSIEATATSDRNERRTIRQGCWGFDRELLQQGEPLACDRDYFRKDGKPMPIVGMTYMASDVSRKFMLLPNPAIWDRDMSMMKNAGINLIRTGIWTAYRNVMFVDGHPYEEVLRAIDAFILTAKKNGLEVTFTFFSFTPELWEGENPYLDPRSVEAQKRFIAAIVSRHQHSTHVNWDLINEPSMFDPKRVFSGPRSSQDRYEQAAYREWLEQRHGTIESLQERWNMTPEELPSFADARLPEPTDINFGTTEEKPKKGAQWLDYTLFSMDMHNRWARQLTETIRSINPRQLVTVGQDEGFASQRPGPFFYAAEMDYTTVHSWWRMDDLVWDGVFTKTLHKPNLVQETGIMYVETPDGRAKRSEPELRNILERKYAYAFSTGGAGAVHWVWNTNIYLNHLNEANIGALRADGTQKPEADVSYDFGRFMNEIHAIFEGRQLEDVAVLFPYSNDYSNRSFANRTTANAIRTLAYQLNIHPRGFSEYHLDALDEQPPKLIILPSAHNLSGSALERILDHVRRHGSTLLATGPLGIDEYWRPQPGRVAESGPTRLANVLREEMLEVEGRVIPVSFGGSVISFANKELPAEQSAKAPVKLAEWALGKGRLLWCPLPVELNERSEPIVEVYKSALSKAGVTTELEWLVGGELTGIYGRKLQFRNGSLYVFVSESGQDANIQVKDPITDRAYRFAIESERSVLFASDARGSLTTVYRPHEVNVTSD